MTGKRHGPEPICPETLTRPKLKRLLQYLECMAQADDLVWNQRAETFAELDGHELTGFLALDRMNWMKQALQDAPAEPGHVIQTRDVVIRRLWDKLDAIVLSGRTGIFQVDHVVLEWQQYQRPAEPIGLPVEHLEDGFTKDILRGLVDRWVMEIVLRGQGKKAQWMNAAVVLIGAPESGKTSFLPNLLGGPEGDHWVLRETFHAGNDYDTCPQAFCRSWELAELAALQPRGQDSLVALLTSNVHVSRKALRYGGEKITRNRMHCIVGTTNHVACIPADVPGLRRRLLPAEIDNIRIPDGLHLWQWILANREPLIAQALHRLEQYQATGAPLDDLFPAFHRLEGYDEWLQPYLKTNPLPVTLLPKTWEDVLAEQPELTAQQVGFTRAKELLGTADDYQASLALKNAGWISRQDWSKEGGGRRVWSAPIDNPATEPSKEPEPEPEPGPWQSDPSTQAAFFTAVTGNPDFPGPATIPNFGSQQFFCVGNLKPGERWDRYGAPAAEQVENMALLAWEWDKELTLEQQESFSYPHPLLRPTHQLNTGGRSVHCYLTLAFKIKPARFQIFLKALATILGTDASINNFNRLMRLPGVAHPETGIASKWRTMGRQPLTAVEFAKLETWVLTTARNAKPTAPSVAPVTAVKPGGGQNPGDQLAWMLSRLPASPAKKQGSYMGYRNMAWGIAAWCKAHGIPMATGEALLRSHSPARADELVRCFYGQEPGGDHIETGTLVAMARAGKVDI